MYNFKKAFTLVELIITITILAILWTIAFISMISYSATARDSVRVSDISKIKTSLDLFQLDAGKYPETTDGFTITYLWNNVWTQWIFWKTTFSNITKLDKIPKDPLTDKEYTYSITQTKQEYQIAWIVESDWFALNSIIWQTNAWDTLAIALVSWTYNGQILKTESWAICNILSLPSIISSEPSTVTDLWEILSRESLVYNWYKNLPTNYISSKYKSDGWFAFSSNKLVVYDDSANCSALYNSDDNTTRIELIKNLQTAYSGTIIENVDNIKRIVSFDETNNEDMDLFSATLVNNTLWWNISLSTLLKETKIEENNDVFSFSWKVLWWTEFDYLMSIKSDNNWNIYVWGFYRNDSYNTNKVTDFNNNILYWKTTTIAPQAYIAKLDSSLNQIWIKTLWWIDWDALSTISIDNSWNIYVWWGFSNNLTNANNVTDFAGNVLYWKTSDKNYTDAFIAKLDSLWNQLWIKTLWWSNQDSVNSIKTDNIWNIYVWGTYYTSSIKDFSNNSLLPMSNTTWYDVYIAKLDNSWNQLWIKTLWWKGAFDDLRSVETDNSWNIYVWWSYCNDLININETKDFAGNVLYWKASLAIYTDTDWFVAKLDSLWNQLWIKTIWWSKTDDVHSLDLDSLWNLYVWWKFINDLENNYLAKDFSDSNLLWKNTNWWYSDAFFTKLDNSWNQLWIKKLWWTQSDSTSSINVVNDWVIYVWWDFRNNTTNLYYVTDFTNSNILWLNPWSGHNLFIWKFDNNWNQLWIKKQKSRATWGVNNNSTYANWILYVWWTHFNDLNNTSNVLDYNGDILYWKSTTVGQDWHIIKIEE